MRWLRLSGFGDYNRPVGCLEIGYELSVVRGERRSKGVPRHSKQSGVIVYDRLIVIDEL